MDQNGNHNTELALDKLFNVGYTANTNAQRPPPPPKSSVTSTTPEKAAEDDFHKARDNMHEMLSTMSQAVDQMSNIASQSEAPRAFEVLNMLLKTYSESNKDLLDIHEKIKQIKKKDNVIGADDEKPEQGGFIGTAADLQQIVKEAGKQTADEKPK